MPTITGGQTLQLGKRAALPKYITVELENNTDMNQNIAAFAPNFVPTCDWFTWDIDNTINGRMMRIDISQQIQQAGIEALQSVYIDNGPNNSAVTVELTATKQRITCPPNSQGWFPLIGASKDGKMTIAYTDKDDNFGAFGPSWLDIAGVNGTGIPVKYKPTFHFTDVAVPGCVWDCRQKSSVLYQMSHQFAGTGIEQVTGGQGTRRMGLRFRALETNVSFIDLMVFNTLFGGISSFIWTLLPGERLEYEGDSTPTNVFYGQAGFAGDILSCHVLV